MKRRTILTHSALAALAATPLALPQLAWRREERTLVSHGLGADWPGPDGGRGVLLAEVTQYNIYETLTKINSDGSVSPLLAESWEVSPDLRTYTFKLRKGVKFQNGEPFTREAVKFSFQRAGGDTKHQ